MNWDQVEGKWTTLKGKAQQRWGKLTEDDLQVIEGRREELIGRLQNRYGDNKEKLEKEVDAWMDSI